MRGPTSPRGWLNLAISVRERHGRPHGVRYQYDGHADARTLDLRETSISVVMMLERASHSISGNGVGYRLLVEHLVEERSWWAFTEWEQHLLRRTGRAFRQELIRGGFLPDLTKDGDGDDL